MYFPYLLTKQFDLLAVRGLLDATPNPTTVTPILEPVVTDSSDLRRCLELMGAAGAPLIVIMNPHQGPFRAGPFATWQKEVTNVLDQHPSLMAGFRCHQTTTLAQVHTALGRHLRNAKALLYSSPTLSLTDFAALGKDARVQYHLALGGVSNAHSAMLPARRLAVVTDYFNKKTRNADYVGREFYTDAHKTTTATAGYGDYTIAGSTFVARGGPAAAVAIHLIYKNSKTGDLWIEHFVSDDVSAQVGNVNAKYLQAARKAVKAFRARPLEFGRNEALDAIENDVRTAHFPGLGKSKERQILHHMLLTDAVLTGRV